MVRVELGDSYLPLIDPSVRDRFVLVEGNRGTGKTRGILSILLTRALRNPGSRWGLFRSTRTRLSETVMTTLEEQVFPAFGMPVPGGAGVENRHRYDLPNGSVFLPMGLDDPQRSQSLELAGMYVAEAVELPKLDTVTALAGALRQAPLASWDPDFSYQCVVDCNPGSPSHWLNQIAVDVPKAWRIVNSKVDYLRLLDFGRKAPPEGKWRRIITRHMDNPAYFDAVAWQWTKAGDLYVRNTLNHLHGHLRRRWLDGVWAAAEGTVFPEFDEDVHVIDDFQVPDSWGTYAFYDPGYDHPTAILWVAVSPNGCYYVVDEIYEQGYGVEHHAKHVLKRNREHPGRLMKGYYGDPHGAFAHTAASPESIATQFQKITGSMLSPWPAMNEKGAKESSVNAVRRRLLGAPPQGKPGDSSQPMLKVFRSCRNTISEFQSWSYKRLADGQLPAGDDQFEDRNNHAMDCLTGAAALNLKFNPAGVIVIDPDKRPGSE